MVRTALPVVLLGVLALSTTHQSTALDPARVATEVSYSRDIKPFFQKYCLECHNSSTAKSKLNVESVATLTTVAAQVRRRRGRGSQHGDADARREGEEDAAVQVRQGANRGGDPQATRVDRGRRQGRWQVMYHGN